MHGNFARYLVALMVAGMIWNQVVSDCLYPKWDTVCQKYCLDKGYLNIELVHCWNEDPDQLHCICNGKELRNTIKRKYSLGRRRYYLKDE